MTSSAVAVETQRYLTPEPELIARVVAGDRLAARELYDAHAPRVFRLAFRLTGDTELAREFTQETFIRAFAQLGRFRGESALSTWLHRVTMSVVSNAMRKVKRFRAREADIEEADLVPAQTRAGDPDMKEKIHRAIDELPEIYRTTLVMHDVEGYTHEEIAQELGITSGGSKSQLFKARAKLRKLLAHLIDVPEGSSTRDREYVTPVS